MSDERKEALGTILKQVLEPVVDSISKLKQEAEDVKEQLERIEAQQNFMLESIQELIEKEKKL